MADAVEVMDAERVEVCEGESETEAGKEEDTVTDGLGDSESDIV